MSMGARPRPAPTSETGKALRRSAVSVKRTLQRVRQRGRPRLSLAESLKLMHVAGGGCRPRAGHLKGKLASLQFFEASLDCLSVVLRGGQARSDFVRCPAA